MRPIKQIHGEKAPHWVGDGFFVKTLINHVEGNPSFNYSHTDPFLLFDYGEPTTFAPNPEYNSQPHGIGKHPHKGFDIVTIAYSGEITHGDSMGGRHDILAGDVQWMTTGRGVLHEEFHSEAFGQRGGVFSMVQMWVNLPSAHKLTEPKYQAVKRADLPVVALLDDNDTDNQTPMGKAVIIAGDWDGITGAVSTFTPINVWDIELHTTGAATLHIPNSHNTLLLVQEGEVVVNGTTVSAGNLIQFDAPIQSSQPNPNEPSSEQSLTSTDTIELRYAAKTVDDQPLPPVKVLLFSGEPIGEPVAGYGPFVMNTQEELRQTFRDYQTGRFGQ
ncbi:pirin family protein [Psychrobacter sp. B38]|uniref:pirin family protein n=1 Tax=Psychrobacter sp. B38 TaxID=3143538 RepID=UPI00320FFF84